MRRPSRRPCVPGGGGGAARSLDAYCYVRDCSHARGRPVHRHPGGDRRGRARGRPARSRSVLLMRPPSTRRRRRRAAATLSAEARRRGGGGGGGGGGMGAARRRRRRCASRSCASASLRAGARDSGGGGGGGARRGDTSPQGGAARVGASRGGAEPHARGLDAGGGACGRPARRCARGKRRAPECVAADPAEARDGGSRGDGRHRRRERGRNAAAAAARWEGRHRRLEGGDQLRHLYDAFIVYPCNVGAPSSDCHRRPRGGGRPRV